uniref:MlaD family protein n=1 Tax=Polaromonas sp. TaxID=1869339 RepID=UPI00286ABCB8
FDLKNKGNVLVRVSIDRSAPVTKSTFATVASQGVTGLGFIQLDDEGESTERLVPNDDEPPRIPLRPGGLDKLLKQSDMIFTQVEQASIRLNRLLSDDNQLAVTGAVTQLSEAAGGINRVAKALEPAVATLPALSRDASASLKSIKSATDEVGVTARRLNEKGGPLDKLSQGGSALAAGVETFSAATLPKVGQVADEANRTLRQLRRTVNSVDDNPQALIFGNGPPQPGPGEPGFSADGAKK